MTFSFQTTEQRLSEIAGTALGDKIHKLAQKVVKRDHQNYQFALSVLLHLFTQNPQCSDSYAIDILKHRLEALNDADDDDDQ